MNKTFAFVDKRISEKCERRLTHLGFTVKKLPAAKGLPDAIASHTDIISFKISDNIFLSKKYYSLFSDIFEEIKDSLHLTEASQSTEYPYDAIFNGLLIGGKLFCKADTFCKEIIEFAKKNGVEIIKTKQGYPACTVLKVSESAAITADMGMYNVLTKNGVDTLLIENEGIKLPPYEYGFIGGAGAVFDNMVYFLGDPTLLPSYNKISAFISKHGKEICSLSDEPLSDLGGILFVKDNI